MCAQKQKARGRQRDSDEATATRAPLLPLIASLVVFVAGAVVMAAYTPPGGGPDEPFHMAYVKSIAEQHKLPLLPGFEVAEQPGRIISQQAQHPPLYYVLSAPAWWITGGDETATYWILRAVGILTFAAVIVLTWLCVLAVFGKTARGQAIASASVFVLSVSTTYGCVGGGVNNEAPATLIAYAALLLAVSRRPERNWWGVPLLTGLVVGCALLTKLTAIALVPVTLFALCRREGASHLWPWTVFRRPTIATLAAAALVAPWLTYNLSVYGCLVPSPSPSGMFIGGWGVAIALRHELATVVWGIARGFVMGTFAPFWILRYTISAGAVLVLTALFWCAVALALVMSRRARTEQPIGMPYVLLGAFSVPVLLYLGILHQTVTMHWDAMIFVARYVPVASPALGVIAGIAAWQINLLQRQVAALAVVIALLAGHVVLVCAVARFFLSH